MNAPPPDDPQALVLYRIDMLEEAVRRISESVEQLEDVVITLRVLAGIVALIFGVIQPVLVAYLINYSGA